MPDNIISLRGDALPTTPTEPHAGVIAFLERLLQDARSGQVQGITCAYMGPDWRAGYSVVGFVGGYSMQGAAHCVLTELARINMGASEREEF
jgi:hypothetical protein